MALIEAKFNLYPNFVNRFATEKVSNFRALFPEYAEHKLYLGIAGMTINDEVAQRAKEFGIGILRQKGDSIECDTENIKAY